MVRPPMLFLPLLLQRVDRRREAAARRMVASSLSVRGYPFRQPSACHLLPQAEQEKGIFRNDYNNLILSCHGAVAVKIRIVWNRLGDRG